ncbi:MAG: DUF805 domain-containing protein [Pseudomonadota bacterium]
MTLGQSIKTCFRKYFVFSGRATRSEFWWFMLFVNIIVSIPVSIVSEDLNSLWMTATFIPSLAVGSRRLHDTNRTGWWQAVPFVSVLPLWYFVYDLGQTGGADFGADLMNHSLFFLIPLCLGVMLIALILLIVWWASRGIDGPNRFGDDPTGATDTSVFD